MCGALKSNRQTVILEIISNEEIQTQNQLLQALDIRDMHLSKEASADGGYRYVAARRDTGDHMLRLQKIFRESVISYDVAQNLFIIRTLPGLASAACSAMDSIEVEGLVGTLAGDDTAFIAMRDNAAALALYDEIQHLF